MEESKPGGSRAAKKRARKRKSAINVTTNATDAGVATAEPAANAGSEPARQKQRISSETGKSAAQPSAAEVISAVKCMFGGQAKDVPAPEVTAPPPTLEEAREVTDVTMDSAQPGKVLSIIALDGLTDQDSTSIGQKVLDWLIHPIPVNRFDAENWERRCLLIRRHATVSNYYQHIFSKRDLRKMLKDCPLTYGEEIDLSKYTSANGRVSLQREGLADSKTIRAAMADGYTLRCNRPHMHNRRLWQLMGWLEEHWGCGAASNVFMTPAGCAGFAPHYSNVEVFALQLEGRQSWKVFAPAATENVLPYKGSEDLSEAELGKPILECTLEPGDLLYLPRGMAFSSVALGDASQHSLELRLSTGADASYVDLLKAALPQALELAAEDDVRLRQLLPRDYLQYMGVAYADAGAIASNTGVQMESESIGLPPGLQDRQGATVAATRGVARAKFMGHVKELAGLVLGALPVDAAADQLGKQQLQEQRLPPPFAPGQLLGCIDGPDVKSKVVIHEDSYIRLATKAAARMCVEGDMATVHHSIDNAAPGTVQYKGRTQQSIVFSLDFAPAIDHLLRSYPDFTCVKELPELDDVEEAVCRGPPTPHTVSDLFLANYTLDPPLPDRSSSLG